MQKLALMDSSTVQLVSLFRKTLACEQATYYHVLLCFMTQNVHGLLNVYKPFITQNKSKCFA